MAPRPSGRDCWIRRSKALAAKQQRFDDTGQYSSSLPGAPPGLVHENFPKLLDSYGHLDVRHRCYLQNTIKLRNSQYVIEIYFPEFPDSLENFSPRIFACCVLCILC